jgi:hypothetical protein
LEYLALAISWTVLPMAIVAEGGLMKMELIEGLTKKPLQAAMATQSRMGRTAFRVERSVAVSGRVVSQELITHSRG